MDKDDSVWIIDDDESIRWVLEKSLSEKGFNVASFESAHQVLKKLETDSPNVIISDIRMPGTSGLDLLDQVKNIRPEIPIIIMTAHSDLESAVESYEHGAWEYLPKPFDIDEAIQIVERAIKKDDKKIEQLEEETKAEIIGEASSMQEVFRAIGKLSNSNSTVLLVGESGTGKELVAKAIYQHSPRRDKTYIALNMADIPKDLLEAELFGHERGAFTGADEKRIGRFEQANEGTLFLDEVADIPLQMQVKLLRVIQEKKLRPVGATQEQTIDCRLLSATHKNLEEQIKHNLFREDLYYRINVIQLSVPPLRTRGNDIIILAQHFLKHICKETHQPLLILSEESTALLQQHSFDGNVRELQNAIQRACALTEGAVITPAHLQLSQPAQPTQPHTQEPVVAQANTSPQPINHTTPVASNTMPVYNPDTCGTLEEYLQQIEAQAIKSVLDATHWNRTAAAERLGMTLRSLRYRLKKLGLDE